MIPVELAADPELTDHEKLCICELFRRGRWPVPSILLHRADLLGADLAGNLSWNLRKLQRNIAALRRVHPRTGRPILSDVQAGAVRWLKVDLPYDTDPRSRAGYVPRVELLRRRKVEAEQARASYQADLDLRRNTSSAETVLRAPAAGARPEPGSRTAVERDREAAAAVERAQARQAIGHVPEGRQVVEEAASQLSRDHAADLQRAVIGSRVEGADLVLVVGSKLQARSLSDPSGVGELLRVAGAAIGRVVRVVPRVSAVLLVGLLVGLASASGPAGIQHSGPEGQMIDLAEVGQPSNRWIVEGVRQTVEHPSLKRQRSTLAALPAADGRNSDLHDASKTLLGEVATGSDLRHGPPLLIRHGTCSRGRGHPPTG